MKEGDFLICKKTYCENFFRYLPLTVFKKGKKYRLEKIHCLEVPLYLTPGGGYTTSHISSTDVTSVTLKEYSIKGEFGANLGLRKIGEDVFTETFYNLKEERKIKLEVLKNESRRYFNM